MSSFLALTWLERIDRTLLHWINCDLHAPWVEDVLLTLMDKKVGIPLAVALLVLVAVCRGWRTGLRGLGTCLLAYLVGWGVAVGAWTVFERPRPPRDLPVVLRTAAEAATCASHPDGVVVRAHVSRRPGMPSQHATHSAAIATALFLAWRWVGVAAALYALLVAAARVHAGVHWPSDVIVGLVLGPLIAWGVWRLLPAALAPLRLRGLVEAPATGAAGSDPTRG